MALRQSHVTVDCSDPPALARWWADLLGWDVTRADDDEAVAKPGGGDERRLLPLLFIKVSEPKTTKNRLHLDLLSDDLDAEVARAEALGAHRLDLGGDDPWVVLADPEGNELCILPPPPDS